MAVKLRIRPVRKYKMDIFYVKTILYVLILYRKYIFHTCFTLCHFIYVKYKKENQYFKTSKKY